MFQLVRFIFPLGKQREKVGIKMGLHIRTHSLHQNKLVQVHLSETFLSIVPLRYWFILLLCIFQWRFLVVLLKLKFRNFQTEFIVFSIFLMESETFYVFLCYFKLFKISLKEMKAIFWLFDRKNSLFKFRMVKSTIFVFFSTIWVKLSGQN